jgi:hypothetical protein
MRSESRTEETSELANRGVGKAHRECGAALDAGRAVADHPVELVPQLGDDAADPVLGERVLVAGLRGRQQEQGLDPLVADQRLRELNDAVHDVDEVVDHAAFGAHHEIEIAQTDVEVDDDDVLPRARQRRPECGRRSRLADAAFTRCYDDDLTHLVSPNCFRRFNALDRRDIPST